jgi:hypothetical protein
MTRRGVPCKGRSEEKALGTSDARGAPYNEESNNSICLGSGSYLGQIRKGRGDVMMAVGMHVRVRDARAIIT